MLGIRLRSVLSDAGMPEGSSLPRDYRNNHPRSEVALASYWKGGRMAETMGLTRLSLIQMR